MPCGTLAPATLADVTGAFTRCAHERNSFAQMNCSSRPLTLSEAKGRPGAAIVVFRDAASVGNVAEMPAPAQPDGGPRAT